jgi:hypothetical protein
MNRFMGYISQCFGQKDLSHYPELFRKNRHELGIFLVQKPRRKPGPAGFPVATKSPASEFSGQGFFVERR